MIGKTNQFSFTKNNDITTGNITLEFTPDTNISNSSNTNNSINMQSIGKGITMSDILSDTKNDNKISSNNTPIASPLFRTAIMYSKNKNITNNNSTFLVESDDD